MENKKINDLNELHKLINDNKKLSFIKEWDDDFIDDDDATYSSVRGVIYSEKLVINKKLNKIFNDIANDIFDNKDDEYNNYFDNHKEAIRALSSSTDISISFKLKKTEDKKIKLSAELYADYQFTKWDDMRDELGISNLDDTIINDVKDLNEFIDKLILEVNKAKKEIWG